MSTSAIPIHMAKTYTKVKVNVRLCGSIPRVDLSSLMKHQHDSHPEIPSSSSNQYNEEDCVAQKLCSHLYTMQHQQQQQQEEQAQHKLIQPQHMFYSEEGISPPSSRRQSPTYEAPSWAVPASGEARLEVSMGNFFFNIFFLHALLLLVIYTMRYKLVPTCSLTIIALLSFRFINQSNQSTACL
jgi:hypothetical protein